VGSSSRTEKYKIEVDDGNEINDQLKRFLNYTGSVHTIISPTQPNLLCIQRGDMFRLSQSHPQAFHYFGQAVYYNALIYASIAVHC
jgi:hypothetical protein